MTDLPLRTADLVGSLWRAAALEREERTAWAVPELPTTTRMVHDPNLGYLNGHRDADLPELLDHLVPLLCTFAERRDELVAEIRLLRESMVKLVERLEERDEVMHRLVEARLDGLVGG